MIEGGSGLASGNGAVSYRRWVCLHWVFGYQLNQVHGVPKSMALCTGFHCQYQLEIQNVYSIWGSKPWHTCPSRPFKIGLAARSAIASFSHGILITDRPQLAGSAVDDIVKSTNYHYQLEPLLKWNLYRYITFLQGLKSIRSNINCLWKLHWTHCNRRVNPYTGCPESRPIGSPDIPLEEGLASCATDCREPNRNTVSIIFTDWSVSQISEHVSGNTVPWKWMHHQI